MGPLRNRPRYEIPRTRTIASCLSSFIGMGEPIGCGVPPHLSKALPLDSVRVSRGSTHVRPVPDDQVTLVRQP